MHTGLEPACLGGLLKDPETKILTDMGNFEKLETIFEKLESHFEKLEKQKVAPFFRVNARQKKLVIGKSSLKNWKTKWKGPWQK